MSVSDIALNCDSLVRVCNANKKEKKKKKRKKPASFCSVQTRFENTDRGSRLRMNNRTALVLQKHQEKSICVL